MQGDLHTAAIERRLDRIRARSIGFIFQLHNLVPTLTAVENVALPLYSLGFRAKERRVRAMARLDAVGLADRAGHGAEVDVLVVALLGGADSLYSIVQMPAGVPVATVTIGEAGAKNAALLAAQILALQDEELHARLQQFRADQRRAVARKNEALRERIADLR